VQAEAAAAAPELRPLSVGEVLDVGIKIYWRHALTLFRIVLVVVAPVQILSALVYTSALSNESGFGTESTTTTTSDTAVWLLVTGFGVVTILSFLASTVSTGACFKAVADAYLSERPTWRSSLGFAFRRLHSIIWVTLLAGVIGLLGAIACLIPGIWLWVLFGVSIPVLLTEGVKGKAALGRSKRLVEGRWWPTFGVLLLGRLFASLLGFVAGIAAGASSALAPGSVVDFVVRSVTGTLGAMISTPLIAAFVTVLYFDLRVRKEGFDLQLLAERIGLAPRAEGEFRPPPEVLRPAGPPPGAKPPYWPPPPGWTPSGEEPEPAAPPVTESADQPPYWPPPPGWRPSSGE
jgi:hypothetical protein